MVADFIGYHLTPEEIGQIVQSTKFSKMKKQAEQYCGDVSDAIDGDPTQFFRKGKVYLLFICNI